MKRNYIYITIAVIVIAVAVLIVIVSNNHEKNDSKYPQMSAVTTSEDSSELDIVLPEDNLSVEPSNSSEYSKNNTDGELDRQGTDNASDSVSLYSNDASSSESFTSGETNSEDFQTSGNAIVLPEMELD